MEDREKGKVICSSQLETKTMSYVPPKIIRLGGLNMGWGDCSTGGTAQGSSENCKEGSSASESCEAHGGNADNGNCTTGGIAGTGNCKNGTDITVGGCTSGGNR